MNNHWLLEQSSNISGGTKYMIFGCRTRWCNKTYALSMVVREQVQSEVLNESTFIDSRTRGTIKASGIRSTITASGIRSTITRSGTRMKYSETRGTTSGEQRSSKIDRLKRCNLRFSKKLINQSNKSE